MPPPYPEARHDAAPRERRRRRVGRVVAQAAVPAAHAPLRSDRRVLRRRRSHHHAGRRAPAGSSTPRPGCFRRIAANVTHVEEGASDPPMRAVLIEVKTAAPRAAGRGAGRWPAPGRRSARLGEQPGRRLGRAPAAPRLRRIVTSATPSSWSSTGPDDAEGDVRAGRNGSRGPDAGRRRAGVHLRDQVGGAR